MEYDAIILSEKVKLANCLASKCSGSQLMLFIYWKRWFFLKKNKIAHKSMHSKNFYSSLFDKHPNILERPAIYSTMFFQIEKW